MASRGLLYSNLGEWAVIMQATSVESQLHTLTVGQYSYGGGICPV